MSRRRGVVLTVAGYHKLAAARLASERAANFGIRYTNEELRTLTGLSLMTLAKIFTGVPDPTIGQQTSVDKKTLDLCFSAFMLTLERGDYFYTDDIAASNPPVVTSVLSNTWALSQSGVSNHFDPGESPDVAIFYGREGELARLSQWVTVDRCRLVAILGMGGTGKTTLVTKLAHQLQPEFTKIVWRSLRNAPALTELLPKLIEICAGTGEIIPSTADLSTQITHLLACFRQQRCLLILDNVEAILPDPADPDSQNPLYPGYAELFERIGTSSHQSCLLLTSREKPAAIIPLAGEQLPVRSLLLRGLNGDDIDRLLDAKGLSASSSGRARLLEMYSGNPLALNIVATSICDLFEGDIDGFLDVDDTIFGDIRQLLDQQFDRLSPLERVVMYWLAIEREWTAPADLHPQIVPAITKQKLLAAFSSLSRRSLIENSDGKFTQQAVVMEYMTARLIDRVAIELDCWDTPPDIDTGLPLWLQYPLCKALSPPYIQAIQKRLFLQPIASQLQLQFPQKPALTQYLQSLVADIRTRYSGTAHYGGGNLFNLLRYLHIDVTGWNFAKLPMWQADFQGTTLYDVDLSGADLSKAMFTCSFGWIFSIAFSPDSQLLVTGEASGNIGLWRLGNRELLDTFTGHTSWVWAIEFSPDGKMLATASQDATVRLWDFATRQVRRVLQADRQQVLSLAFHPDGRLVTAHSCGRVRIWNVTTGEIEQTISAHANQVFLVKLSPDGRSIATGSDDGTIKLWDFETGNFVGDLDTQTDRAWSVKFSPDNTLIATGCSDGTIKLWDIATGLVLTTLPGYSQWIVSTSFSPDGRMLATAHSDNDIKVWNVRNLRSRAAKPQIPIATLRRQSAVAALIEFSPNSQLLVTGDTDRSIKLWDTTTWQELSRWEGHTNGISSLTVTPDGSQVIGGCHDGIVRVWDVQMGSIVQTLMGHDRGLFAVDYHPQQQTIASASEDRTVKVWNAHTGTVLQTIAPPAGAAWSVRFSPDGQFLASSGVGGEIYLWSETGALAATLSGHQGAVKSIVFSPDGQLMASTSFDASWRLWDLEAKSTIHSQDGYPNWLWDLAFSPDGRYLAVSGVEGVAQLWEVATCKLLQTFTGHTQEIIAIAFSPNGQQLATSSADRSIKIWEIATGKLVQTLNGHFDRVNSICYHPDSRSIFSGSGDETIKIWDLDTSTCLRSLQPPAPYLGLNIHKVDGLTTATIGSLRILGANLDARHLLSSKT